MLEHYANDSRPVFLLVQASGVRSNVPGTAFREQAQASGSAKDVIDDELA